MNMDYPESPYIIMAKTCGCKANNRKVTYAFLNETHALSIDKKDLISAQIGACEKLLKYTTDKDDRIAVEKEISELRMALDLLP